MFNTKGVFSIALASLPLFFCAGNSFAAPASAADKQPATVVNNPSVTGTKSESAADTTSLPDSKNIKDHHESVATFQQVSNPVPHIGVNWDLYAGYAFSNWSGFTNGGNGAWAYIGGINPRDHAKGGLNIGGDLGYQIIRYLGMEFGYYHFEKVAGDDLSVETPYFYAAAKVGYPFLTNDDLNVFAKLGVAYRMIEYGGGARQGVYNNKRHSINLLYGLGLEYYFTDKWKASAQWLEIPEYTSGGRNTKQSSKQVPRTDQLLLGLGYLFSI